jgi:hypothetical protein
MLARAIRRLAPRILLAALALGLPGAEAFAADEGARLEREAVPDSLRGWVRELPPRERRAALRRLRRMDPERREAFVQRFESMSDDERARLRERLGSAAEARGERPERFERNRRAWSEMDDAERERMRERLRRFQALAPDEQEALVERRFTERSPEERARILERMRRAVPREP